jgi:UDP:flavonoid glycosyltransferase YjiC (YdhE family)
MPPNTEQLQQAEQHVLDCVNQVLERRHAEPLERITQLYGQVDDTFLTTLPEFDHYPDRLAARFRGPWSLPGGDPPIWPAGSGKRIYAYLSPFPGLPKILHTLQKTGCPAIIFGTFDQQVQERFTAPHLRFETQRLDLQEVAAQCDLAILNGGQATTLAILLAGKPILQAPIFLEQAINAMSTVRIGAGLMAFPGGVDRTEEQIAELLNTPKFTDAARTFAAKYATFSADAEIAQAVVRLNELAASGRA